MAVNSRSGRDGQVYLWDLTQGKEIHRFVEHQEQAMSVAFAPDGRFAVSGGHDIWVIVWGLPAVDGRSVLRRRTERL